MAMSMSTCKAVDMEQVKRRRIEAIRGQILSKLKLTEPPEVQSEEITVPREVLSVYNSTVDMIKEKIKKEKPVVEEYYSKQVEKIEIITTGKITVTSLNIFLGVHYVLFFFVFYFYRVHNRLVRGNVC